MKKITDAQFTKSLCEVLAYEKPTVIYQLMNKAGINVDKDLSIMDAVKEIRNLK